jgi:hypothetical protein
MEKFVVMYHPEEFLEEGSGVRSHILEHGEKESA